jgi:NTE family protein
MTIEQIRDKKVGIALYGRGVRGMAHIRLLELLQSYGIRPQYISGTSVGAIVGALYAWGRPTRLASTMPVTSLKKWHADP